jgi:hypothetical protein
MLAHAPQSRTLLASLLCMAAVACGGSDDGGERNVSPGVQPDSGQTTPPLSNDGGAQGGQPGQTSDGGGGQGATMGGGTTGGGTTGDAGTASAADAGKPDLGENSQGDTFLRADTLVLKAPNMYVQVPLLGAQDVTNDGQNALNTALTSDDDADDFVDMSMLLRFLNTSDPKAASGKVTPGGAMCQWPIGPDMKCGPDKTFPFQSPPLEYTNASQPCALTGTQETAPAPCFATTPASLTMQLPILGAVPLQDGQIVGSWDGANIKNGFVRGFLPKTVAAQTKLGAGVPPLLAVFNIKMGTPLINFFSEAQIGQNAKGEAGWWVVMSYTAKSAKFDPALPVPAAP